MVSAALRSKLLNLRDQTLKLLPESLDESDSKVYRALVDMAAGLSALVVPSPPPPPPDTLPVFASYKGQRYDAQFDKTGVSGGRPRCILFRGQWLTPARAAHLITNNSVNGWRFWRYRAENGTDSFIGDLRRLGREERGRAPLAPTPH